MNDFIQIDDFSFSSMQVRLFFNDEPCGSATAFAWKGSDDQTYLITNWHVVSGRRSDNGRNLSDMGIWPNRLHMHPPRPEREHPPADIRIQLYKLDEPKWLLHPQWGRQIDVVALPIPDTALIGLRPINALPQARIPLSEGDDLFILGFPKGLTGGFEFPIWKRGTVSSVPSLNYQLLPCFLVDAATGQGMSGSPVVRRDRARAVSLGHDVEYLPNKREPRAPEQLTRFVGVYSGRLADEGIEATIGKVWRAEVIEEIITGGRRGGFDD